MYDQITRQPYSRDPRYVATKAEAYLKQTGIARTSYWGPEAEFFLFSDVRYGGGTNSAFYYIDSNEGGGRAGRTQTQPAGAILPSAVISRSTRTPSKMCAVKSFWRWNGRGRVECITTRPPDRRDRHALDSLKRMADKMLMCKYIVKNVARQNN
jgi:glutamine synthetase